MRLNPSGKRIIIAALVLSILILIVVFGSLYTLDTLLSGVSFADYNYRLLINELVFAVLLSLLIACSIVIPLFVTRSTGEGAAAGFLVMPFLLLLIALLDYLIYLAYGPNGNFPTGLVFSIGYIWPVWLLALVLLGALGGWLGGRRALKEAKAKQGTLP